MANSPGDETASEPAPEAGISTELAVDPDQAPADRAQAAWEAALDAHGDGPTAAVTRTDAYVTIEQAIREDAVVLPLYHGLTERFWDSRVTVPEQIVPTTGWYQHDRTAVAGTEELTALTGPIFSLDPLEWVGPPSGVLGGVYETVTAFPEGRIGDSPRHRLLADHESADGGRTWRLTLRSDVEFHDGRRLTAADVVYSWRRAVENNPGLLAPWPTGLGVRAEKTDDGLRPGSLERGLSATDDRTIELRLTDPNPDLLSQIADSTFAVLPVGLVDDVTGYNGELTQERLADRGGIGTGPFAFETVDLGTEIRVKRTDRYYGPQPRIDAIRWQVREGDSAWTAVLENNADIFGVPKFAYDPAAISAETTSRGRRTGSYGPADLLTEPVVYRAAPALTTVYLAANVTRVSRAVRRAVAELISRVELIRLVGDRRAPAATVAPPPLWPTTDPRESRTDPYQRVLADDPYGRVESRQAAAGERLAAAGISAASPVTHTLTVYDSEPLQLLAEHLADRLEPLGVELSIEEVSTFSLFERGENGRLGLWLAGLRWPMTIGAELARVVPANTNTDRMPDALDGLYLDWQTALERQ